MGTYEKNRISLSVFNERFILKNGIETLSYFCKDLKK